MSEGNCASCRYMEVVFIDIVDPEDDSMEVIDVEPDSICRRSPPENGWPFVMADDWCGEWQERVVTPQKKT